ncbi:MAG: GNAT family N-acetyltransferase [Anaerolineales bacterium]|nr:GNAT family N-acetyltransferase [Anaerolineales bacterium]
MIQILTDKSQIAAYLWKSPEINLYHLGDLDAFFWPHTRWVASLEKDQITALALIYTGEHPPVLLAILNENEMAMRTLLAELIPDLPKNVYAHLSPGLETCFEASFAMDHHGQHDKMVLAETSKVAQVNTHQVVPLAKIDLPRIKALYQAAYPESWFNPRMIETGQYIGIENQAGQLIAVAGVHVYSPEFGVAALGNITTLPAQRGRGLAKIITAGCCQRLLETVDLIGLNVRSDNLPAVRVYQSIGFEKVGIYHEWMLTRL